MSQNNWATFKKFSFLITAKFKSLQRVSCCVSLLGQPYGHILLGLLPEHDGMELQPLGGHDGPTKPDTLNVVSFLFCLICLKAWTQSVKIGFFQLNDVMGYLKIITKFVWKWLSHPCEIPYGFSYFLLLIFFIFVINHLLSDSYYMTFNVYYRFKMAHRRYDCGPLTDNNWCLTSNL